MLTIAIVVAFGVGAAFAGGFLLGRQPAPAADAQDVQANRPIAPSPESPAKLTVPEFVEVPAPVISLADAEPPREDAESSSADGPATNTTAPVTTRAPATITTPPTSNAAPPSPALAPAPAARAAPVEPVVGRILVRSTPEGATVTVDGEYRGITPIAIRGLALKALVIEIAYPGHDSQQRLLTLTTDRPAQSIEVDLRPS